MNYKKQSENKDIEKLNDMLERLPDYVKNYVISIEYTTTPKTRLEYVKDITCFLDYLVKKNSINICDTNSYHNSDITLYQKADTNNTNITDTNNIYDADTNTYHLSDTDIINIDIQILNKMSKIDYERYFHHLQNYEKDGQIYSNSDVSIKRKLSAIRSFMTYLYEENLINSNIITKVKIPKLKHKEVIFLDKDETKDFLNAVDSGGALTPKQAQYHKIQSTRDLAICYLMLSTGIRVSECVGLDIKDVDFKKSSLHIYRKGGKEAYVYFSDEASAYLMEYYEQRRNIETKEGHEQALFLSSRKSRITDRSIENIVKKYAQRAVPSKHITPHKLRSTFATALYEKTGDLYLVSEDLGHNDISTTKVYAQVSNKRKEEHRNELNFR